MNINKRIEAIAEQLENTNQKALLSYVKKCYNELLALEPFLKEGGVHVLPFFQEVWVDGKVVEGEDSPFRIYISLREEKVSWFPHNANWSAAEVLAFMKSLHGLYKDYETYL